MKSFLTPGNYINQKKYQLSISCCKPGPLLFPLTWASNPPQHNMVRPCGHEDCEVAGVALLENQLQALSARGCYRHDNLPDPPARKSGSSENPRALTGFENCCGVFLLFFLFLITLSLLCLEKGLPERGRIWQFESSFWTYKVFSSGSAPHLNDVCR